MGCFRGFHPLLKFFSEGICDRLLSHMPARSRTAAPGDKKQMSGTTQHWAGSERPGTRRGAGDQTLSSVSFYETKVTPCNCPSL